MTAPSDETLFYWPETDPLADIDSARSIAIVGNRPRDFGEADVIDAADRIVRFNNAFGFGGSTGRRVTDLVAVNYGGAMTEWLEQGTLERSAAFEAAERIILPIHPDKDRSVRPSLSAEEWSGLEGPAQTARAIARFRAHGKPVLLLPANCFVSAAAAIGIRPLRRRSPAPSSGYLLMHALLSRVRSDQSITAYGFGFAGWTGHDFNAERQWFVDQAATGRLALAESSRTDR